MTDLWCYKCLKINDLALQGYWQNSLTCNSDFRYKRKKVIIMEAAENDEIKRGTRLKQGHTVPLLFKYETLISQLSPSGCNFPS